VDSFDTSTYTEGAGRLIEALGKAGIDVDYLPAHLVPARFPGTAADLAAYGAVILSDIGANSLLLAPATFERSAAAPNRLASVEQYVRDGGGLLMIGGYLSFAGIEGKARYYGTPVEAALPVTISPHDDRAERPEGVHPVVVEPGHPVLDGVPEDWPDLLGYNRLAGTSAAQILVRCEADPLLAVGSHGAGRSAAFASDCAPHWCPPGFMAWPGYDRLWGSLLRWLAGQG
jgi:uncharacterized membrane protein